MSHYSDDHRERFLETEARLLTTDEAALLAGVAAATIRQWVHRGILTPISTRQRRFRVEDVDEAERVARTRDQSGRSQRRTVGE